MDELFLIHFALTCFMTGLIWWVQIVHYPLFGLIPAASFVDYERQHVRRAGWVVAVPMAAELLTGMALLKDPGLRGQALFWVGTGLLGVIWVCTGLVQVRQHGRLIEAFDNETHRALVRWNWVRTSAWTLRSMLLGWLAISRI